MKRLGGGGLALEVVGPFAPPSHHLGKILKGDYCQPLRRFVTVCEVGRGRGSEVMTYSSLITPGTFVSGFARACLHVCCC